MGRTFASECERKEKQLSAWDELIAQNQKIKDITDFGEIYEGMALVTGVFKNIIDLHLETDEIIRNLPVGSRVCEHISRMDNLYVVLGKQEGKWWVIDVMSIGSPMNFEENVH